ncbi:MAG TPA: VOC family protein [Actinomycetota bacterium]|nr:VOC family protein [Actinomycetota bacterium]
MTTRASLIHSTLIDHIARVDLRVRDIDRSLSFYRSVVGLEVAEATATRAALRSPEGEVFIELSSEGVSRPAAPGATGLFHIAIRFPTRSSLGDALARLADTGMEIGAGDHLVSEALYINDPDGNGVELYRDRPIDQWPPPSGDMAIPMATLPVDLRALLEDGHGRDAIGEAAPAGTDMGHVHLQVSDIHATTGFYSDVLGLDRTAMLGDSAGFFSSNGYHHHIGVNTWRSRGATPVDASHAGLERIVFAVADPGQLDDLSSRLGYQPVAESDGSEVLTARDPDGVEMQFTLTNMATAKRE